MPARSGRIAVFRCGAELRSLRSLLDHGFAALGAFALLTIEPASID
jgi:hypothetical protein